MLKRRYRVDGFLQKSAIPVGGPDLEPPRGIGREGGTDNLESPLAFILMLIRHARRSRGITAPKRRIA